MKGIATKPTGTAAIDKSPINLFGITRNKLKVGNKYHSGNISSGVAKGFDGSPNPEGSKIAKPTQHAIVPKITIG